MISVIVPVFNTEKHLKQCLDSILSQTYQEFELIIVNDGSTDSCPQICQEYSQKDKRISVYNKQNGGLPSARKYGIEHASGEFLVNIDSDDWIEPNYLKLLVEEAERESADIVICDYFIDYGSHKVRKKNNFSNIKEHDNVLRDCLRGNVAGYIWNRIIRTSCYKEFNIQFPTELSYGEDMITNVQLLSHNIKVSYIQVPLYHYMQYDTTMMHSKNHGLIYDLLRKKTNWIKCYLGESYKDDVSYLEYKEGVAAFRSGIITGTDLAGVDINFFDKLKQMKENGVRLNMCLIPIILRQPLLGDYLRIRLF